MRQVFGNNNDFLNQVIFNNNEYESNGKNVSNSLNDNIDSIKYDVYNNNTSKVSNKLDEKISNIKDNKGSCSNSKKVKSITVVKNENNSNHNHNHNHKVESKAIKKENSNKINQVNYKINTVTGSSTVNNNNSK